MRAALPILLGLSTLAAAGPHGPEGWARGDIHLHTRYSDDGRWTVASLWDRIVESLPVGPRFAVISDHCDIAGFFPNPARPPTKDQWGTWEETRALRGRLGKGDWIGTGQEIGGLRGGHVGPIFLPQDRGEGPPRIIGDGAKGYADWMKRVREAGGLNVVYHPRGVAELGPIHPGTFKDWKGCLPFLDAIDVWNGYKLYDAPDRWAWDRVWQYWLEGRRLTAVSGSDAHQPAPDDQPLDWWGREGKVSFHCHPLNPHMRVRTGPTVDGDILRAAFKAGRVTIADWPENWLDLRVAVGAASAGIGEVAEGPGAGPAVVTVRGHGAPRVYSGEPSLVLEYGRVGDSERSVLVRPIPRGDFAHDETLALGPGEWVVTARIEPGNPIDGYWRGVQLANPARLVLR